MKPENTKWLGKWVRFYQNGRLVIGVVQYVSAAKSWERQDTLHTDIGAIGADDIEEVR